MEDRLQKRFWSKVNKLGPVVRTTLGNCWEWTGCIRKGYGKIWINNENLLAHRVAWFLETGDDPAQHVLHACDNPRCVRFSHLFIGSQADNVADMMAKGRCAKGEQRPKSKLTEAEVIAIRGSKQKQAELARFYGVNDSTISCIVHRKLWKHVGD